MSQITVRNLPEPVESRLRQLASSSGSSLNQTVVRLLQEATGTPSAVGQRRSLTAFIGCWNPAEADAFDAAVGIFESIDAEVWR